MRTSHYYFILVCVLWVTFFSYLNLLVGEDVEGIEYWLGRAVGSLWIPGLGYATYLFFVKRREKKKSTQTAV